MVRSDTPKLKIGPWPRRLSRRGLRFDSALRHMASAAFTDAYVKYLTQFPTLLSLGTDAATWLAELAAVSPAAFDAVTATSLSLEGGNMAGSRNFPQMDLVRALYAVRAARDPDFTNPYSEPIPEPMAGKRLGSIIRLGYGDCYP